MSLTKVSYSMITGAPINVLDYGAKGDGSTNDTVAIKAAATACNTSGQPLYIPAGEYIFDGNLEIKSTFGVVAEPGAQFTASGSAVTDAPCFLFQDSIYWTKYYVLPAIVGYPGPGIKLYGSSYVNVYCPLIASGKDGILLITDVSKNTCIDNQVTLNGMNAISNSCIQFKYDNDTVTMQNNLFKANFFYTVKYGIYFNGPQADGAKVNENRFEIEALDGGGISGGVGIFAPNQGLTGPMYYEFKSSFVNFEQFFNVGNCSGQNIEAYFDMSGVTGEGNYGAFAISGINVFDSFLVQFPTVGSPVAAMTTSNSRSSFNGGLCLLANRQQLIGITPSGGMVDGDILYLYTYSPFTSGDGLGQVYDNNVRITMNQYSSNVLKLVPLFIKDNSNNVANEILIAFIAVGTVAGSNGFLFTVDVGY